MQRLALAEYFPALLTTAFSTRSVAAVDYFKRFENLHPS
jgi:hypothetical protein